MNLITPFDPWKNKDCSCPPKYSLSPYTGCSHGCLYCYACSYIRNFQMPRGKKEFMKRLDKEIKKIPPNCLVSIANSSDPYIPLEKKLHLTRKTLEVLKTCNLKVNIVTKSSLILKDLEILKNSRNIIISISLTTLSKKLARKLEPEAPLPEERLEAIKKLSLHLPVICRFDPLIYPLNTVNIPKFVKTLKQSGVSQIITSTYKAKPDNFKKMISAFPEHSRLWKDLYYKEGERKNRCLYLPLHLREKLIKEVKESSLKEKLKFSSCREGLTHLNTAGCDGSHLFCHHNVILPK